ncbi:MAG TPA: tripartite tricarboxylate transporter substrate binding protein [Burkholderiales bacterium]|nr:tripartite tricarboxylate transporter substrate binding protein [Burkholderiales bacterium]
MLNHPLASRSRRIVGIVATAIAVASGAESATAQTFPSRAVRFIVPAPPGGGADILARTLGQRLGELWGQQFVIDNRAGAGGIVGTDLAAKALPDGHTILMAYTSHAINQGLYAKLPYDSIKDFAPIALVAQIPNVLALHPSVQAKSVKELIALAKDKPGTLLYASAGSGTSTHLSGALFNSMAGINMVHVPYKGATPAFTDLVGGQVSLMFANMASSFPHVRAGRLRALAVTGRKRSMAAPDLPTIDEAALPGYEANAWFAVLAPRATSAATVDKLNRAMVGIIEAPDVREKLFAQGVEPMTSTPAELGRFLTSEIVKWTRVVKESGARPD